MKINKTHENIFIIFANTDKSRNSHGKFLLLCTVVQQSERNSHRFIPIDYKSEVTFLVIWSSFELLDLVFELLGFEVSGFIVTQQSCQRKRYFGLESSKINVITYSNCLRVVRTSLELVSKLPDLSENFEKLFTLGRRTFRNTMLRKGSMIAEIMKQMSNWQLIVLV